MMTYCQLDDMIDCIINKSDIEKGDFFSELGEMFLGNVVGVSLHNDFYLAYLQEFLHAILILQVQQLEHCC